VNFEKGDRKGNNMAGGTAAILLGLFTLTIQFTMGATHTWDGINYADAFNAAMTLVGSALMLGGVGYLIGLEKFRTTTGRFQVRARSA